MRNFSILKRVGMSGLMAVAVCLSLGATDPSARFNSLSGKVMCSCGCEQILKGCDHIGCTYRDGEMTEMKTGIANGQSDALILDSFVQRYGSTVLAAPTTQGFDLLAWIMPFAVAAAALIGTIFFVRHWAKNQQKMAPVGGPISTAEPRQTEAMRERIRRETGTEL